MQGVGEQTNLNIDHRIVATVMQVYRHFDGGKIIFRWTKFSILLLIANETVIVLPELTCNDVDTTCTYNLKRRMVEDRIRNRILT